MAAGHDQHSSDKQLSADMTRWVGTLRTCGNSGGFSEECRFCPHHFTQLSNRFSKAVPLGSVPPCGAMQRGVEKSILAGDAPAYRILVRFRYRANLRHYRNLA
jgi:hypothetical protein